MLSELENFKAMPFENENPPEYVVREALASGDASVCGSLNEPTLLFEYLLDVFTISKKKSST